MATIDLGKIKLTWKGTYAGGTAYVPDDVVEYTDSGVTSSYICTTASTGNAPSSSGTVHGSWAYMAKGGAGTPTTTRGDIIYRGASADQRLAKGTQGHYLKMGANDPEWAAVAADWVKLASGTISAGASTVDIDNKFDNTTYRVYKLFVSNVTLSATNKVYVRFIGTDGSADQSSNYKWNSSHPYGTSSHNVHGSGSQTFIPWVGDNNLDTGYCFQGEMTIFDPYTAVETICNFHSSFWGDSQWNGHIGGGMYDQNEAHRGIQILPNSGTISGGYYQLYGLKH